MISIAPLIGRISALIAPEFERYGGVTYAAPRSVLRAPCNA
jgi:hypothetical protein